jgi:hypothetical protein
VGELIRSSQGSLGNRKMAAGTKGNWRSRRSKYPTSTVAANGQIVPWLAAEGPLAYTPESPPDRDYFFKYNYVLPGVFADDTNIRLHYHFGGGYRLETDDIFDFWAAARRGEVKAVAVWHGKLTRSSVAAPVAVYEAKARFGHPGYLLMQHGSYQLIDAEYQPYLPKDVLLYRGVQKARVFKWISPRNGRHRRTWQQYVATQGYVLSDSIRSFNSIHDRAVRCETGHIRDRSRVTNDYARDHGLDIDSGWGADLWDAVHQSFSLAQWVGKDKFGPNYIVGRTPLSNIRLTTFFAGENEVRVIDPDKVRFVECHGCSLG